MRTQVCHNGRPFIFSINGLGLFVIFSYIALGPETGPTPLLLYASHFVESDRWGHLILYFSHKYSSTCAVTSLDLWSVLPEYKLNKKKKRE